MQSYHVPHHFCSGVCLPSGLNANCFLQWGHWGMDNLFSSFPIIVFLFIVFLINQNLLKWLVISIRHGVPVNPWG